jgi:hypothetical protein
MKTLKPQAFLDMRNRKSDGFQTLVQTVSLQGCIPFSKQLKVFLRSLIRQRTLLVVSHRSLKNEMTMRCLIEKFHPYSSYAFTDLGAARFLIGHQAEIRLLIPEHQKSIIDRLAELVSQANDIVSPKLF